jgi:multidrug efflux pump subunit AcrA (membrane-fusion protein)
VDRSQVYVVFKVTEGNMSKATALTWQGMHITAGANGNYTFRFYNASAFPDHTLPEPEIPDTPQPDIDYGSGYTAAQIAQMRAEQEKAIRDLQFQIKMAEADYKIKQTEAADSNVYAQLDGTVVSLLTPDESVLNMQPLMKVSSGGGFYVQGSVGELQKDNLQIGQEVTVNDWNTGMTYTGSVISVADYPAPNDGGFYGNGNPNVSVYPFTVFIDGSADLQAGSYVSVMYSAASVESGIYLENPFLRTEQGQSYVYVAGEDGLLEKRFVTTGKSLWGNYTEILDGLTAEDLIAFPYGKTVKEGAETLESDHSTLYG